MLCTKLFLRPCESLLFSLLIVRELGDKVTLYQCHSVLASLNRKGRKDHHIASALSNWQAALGIARELRDKAREADTLRELALVSVY